MIKSVANIYCRIYCLLFRAVERDLKLLSESSRFALQQEQTQKQDSERSNKA